MAEWGFEPRGTPAGPHSAATYWRPDVLTRAGQRRGGGWALLAARGLCSRCTGHSRLSPAGRHVLSGCYGDRGYIQSRCHRWSLSPISCPPPTSRHLRQGASRRKLLPGLLKATACRPYWMIPLWDRVHSERPPRQRPLPAAPEDGAFGAHGGSHPAGQVLRGSVYCWLPHQSAQQHPRWPIRSHSGPGAGAGWGPGITQASP